jgi:hypothetical protein
MSTRAGEAEGRFEAWAKTVPFLRPEDLAIMRDDWINAGAVVQLLLAAAINRLADVLERQGK